ncbi:MAG: universal stress protein [Firmicutes bacterium]|nr:universal stress protein [Bacillota bacterium]
MEKEIILFVDPSRGSESAAALAADLAVHFEASLKVYYLIDSNWGGLLGDEWINTAETRMRFYEWFERELKATAAATLEKVKKIAEKRGVPVVTQILTGPVEKIIAGKAGESPGAWVVLPNPRAAAPAAAGGLRYNIGRLIKKLNGPVVIGPK